MIFSAFWEETETGVLMLQTGITSHSYKFHHA